MVLGTFGGYGGYPKIEAKTADYQVVPGDHGKRFTNKAAGATVDFTLPAITEIVPGFTVSFSSMVLAQDMSVNSSEGNNLVAMNDIAASSITLTTASEIAGCTIVCVFDGTLWICEVHLGTDAQTVTIA